MEDKLDRLVLSFDDKEYQIENFRICPNPTCDCTTIGFLLDDVLVSLDVVRKEIAENPVADRETSEKVVDILTDEQWELLLYIYYDEKNLLIENIEDYSCLRYDFSNLSVEQGNIFYDWIFPNAQPFVFEHEGAFFAVVDQYCLNPECSCKHVILSFYKAEESFQKTPLKNCVLDYQKNRFLPLEEGDVLDWKLIASFTKAKPSYTRFYKKRHAGLRLMYDTYLQSRVSREKIDQEAIINAFSKIGRNDPCPCGSGKKYKKCCGSNK